MIRFLAGFLMLLMLLSIAGAFYQSSSESSDLATFPPPGQFVDVGGHRLHLVCQGSGGPTVVLESGLGNDVNFWSEVIPPVAKFTRVCAYDRAGLGWSDAGPMPRSAPRIVDELSILLKNSGEAPPYILAGHSNGGPYVRLYASSYPDRVAGLVLVDPNPETKPGCSPLPQPARTIYGVLVTMAPLGAPRLALPMLFPLDNSPLKPAGRKAHGALRARTSALRAVWSETKQTCDMLDAVRAASAPAIPTIVLVDQPDGDSAQWQREMADQIGAQEVIVADNTTHWIQLDRPELVVDSIRRLVERAAPP
ncbi:MAG: alpha/beta hydrolase [Xanthomonadales bacterium]|nr:alpha/beta hydrolase [Xanthomonadales bacterium]